MTNNSTLTGTINSLQTGKDALERKLYDLSQKIEPLFKHLIDAETRNEITMTKAMEAEQVIDLLRRTLRTAAREAAKSRVYSMYPGLSQGGSRRQSTHVILGSNGYPARPLVAANA
jgi:peptidoglycan hydrolase CwlO-like protein